MKEINKDSILQDLKKFSIEDLNTLAKVLRDNLITSVTKTGGHLSSNLGVIELTIALHKVFDSPNDRIVFDVGHQGYIHKMLTGRWDKIDTVRQEGGLSGFLSTKESIHDCFGAGHSSTSISAALGMAVARDLNLEKSNVVAVIGDSAMSAGMAFEALNNAGFIASKLIVILNDNDMSISAPTGALSQYFCKMTTTSGFQKIREISKHVLSVMPETIRKTAEKLDNSTRSFNSETGDIFEQMGFHYYGPIDGHNIEYLVKILENLKHNENKPVLLHIKTKKGYGYSSAEEEPEKYHGISAIGTKKSTYPTFTNVVSENLIKLGEKDKSVVTITAAMPTGVGLDKFAKLYPDRFFDVGIAEQHAVTFAAGLVTNNIKPFVAIYSTFLQRSFDQIIHDVDIQNLAVRFLVDRAGYVGADGATHAGLLDLNMFCSLPNMVVMAPSTSNELEKALLFAYEHDTSPSMIRYPRAEAIPDTELNITEPQEPYIFGKARIINKGEKIIVYCLGTLLKEAQEACFKLAEKTGINPTLLDARFAKPIDKDLILSLLDSHDTILTIEEGNSGGFNMQVVNFLNEKNLLGQIKLKFLTAPDFYIDQSNQETQRSKAKLNSEAIFETLNSLIN